MERKRQEYFNAGVRLIWEVDPVRRAVFVYDAIDHMTRAESQGIVGGGDVLPGFEFRVADLFAQADNVFA